jgi:hypothetical protein
MFIFHPLSYFRYDTEHPVLKDKIQLKIYFPALANPNKKDFTISLTRKKK